MMISTPSSSVDPIFDLQDDINKLETLFNVSNFMLDRDTKRTFDQKFRLKKNKLKYLKKKLNILMSEKQSAYDDLVLEESYECSDHLFPKAFYNWIRFFLHLNNPKNDESINE